MRPDKIQIITLLLSLSLCGGGALVSCSSGDPETTPYSYYTNPVYSTEGSSAPAVMAGADGTCRMYIPVGDASVGLLTSRDLVRWSTPERDYSPVDDTWYGDAPSLPSGAQISAVSVSALGRGYVMYWAAGSATDGWLGTIGVATATSPDGPWTDGGVLMRASQTGIKAPGSPCAVTGGEGSSWIAWSSASGIWIMPLSDDGLSAAGAPEPLASADFSDGYLYRHGDLWYLFACTGSGADGRLVVGRSAAAAGPYYSLDGVPMLLGGSTDVIGPNTMYPTVGRCIALVTAADGSDWIFYSGGSGTVMLSPLRWHRGWPVVAGGAPASRCVAPSFED